MGLADAGRLGDLWVVHQGRLHFHGADSVAGDVDYVINPAQQPEVAILVQLGAVSGEIDVRVARPILLNIPFFITVNGAEH